MDDADGTLAVVAARAVVDSEVRGGEADIEFPRSFDRLSGVFVTLKSHPSMELRGCIGYPEPALPLRDALTYAAQSACHDPRFPDLTEREADACVVEVTVLTEPEEVRCPREELPGRISVGRDGLMLELGRRRGLLLPQVPVEWGWNAREYLAHLSLKAGLPADGWKLPAARVLSFQGEVFAEESPRGEVGRRRHGPGDRRPDVRRRRAEGHRRGDRGRQDRRGREHSQGGGRDDRPRRADHAPGVRRPARPLPGPRPDVEGGLPHRDGGGAPRGRDMRPRHAEHRPAGDRRAHVQGEGGRGQVQGTCGLRPVRCADAGLRPRVARRLRRRVQAVHGLHHRGHTDGR